MFTQSALFDIYSPKESPFNIIYAEITHKCNMSCTNCYIPNRDIQDMNLISFIEVMKQLPRSTEIRLIGGEPTLNPQLFEFIEAVYRYNHIPVLVSNGLKLARREFVDRLVKYGLKYVYISASGFNDDTIYALTDNMRCADLKMSAIRNAEEVGLEVGIGCLLMKGVNTHLVPDMIKFVKNLKVVSRINFRNVGRLGRYTPNKSEYLQMSEMVKLISVETGVPEKKIYRYQLTPHQIRFPIPKGKEKMWIKITDWQPENQILPDPGSIRRGRITQDYQIAPFFEHVKANEFGY